MCSGAPFRTGLAASNAGTLLFPINDYTVKTWQAFWANPPDPNRIMRDLPSISTPGYSWLLASHAQTGARSAGIRSAYRRAAQVHPRLSRGTPGVRHQRRPDL